MEKLTKQIIINKVSKQTNMDKISLSKNELLYLISVFITNVGNGMYTIAISKILYDKTSSAMAFGGIVIMENIISVLVQFIAGAVVDRINCKKLSVFCDYIRGMLFITSAVIIGFANNISFLIVALVIINIVNSFYKPSNFRLFSIVANNSNKFLKLNSISSMLLQLGQVLGAVLVIPILLISNTYALLFINGITFAISAYLVSCTKLVINTEKRNNIKFDMFTIISDWVEVSKELYKDHNLGKIVCCSLVDPLIISFINIMLVPLVSNWYVHGEYMVSLLDGSFAIGAISSIVVIKRLVDLVGKNKIKYLAITVQGSLFIALLFLNNKLYTIAILFLIGMFSTISVVVYQTLLQENISANFKGKVSSIRMVLSSIISIVMIPIVTKMYDKSIELGVLTSGCIIISMGILIVVLNKNSNLNPPSQ